MSSVLRAKMLIAVYFPHPLSRRGYSHASRLSRNAIPPRMRTAISRTRIVKATSAGFSVSISYSLPAGSARGGNSGLARR